MLIQADARHLPLPDRYVQTVITSPPYWGLRDYGIEGQLGLEKTPQEYVEHLVEVFRELRRVLRDDGTCWLNLGDSYAQCGGRGEQGSTSQRTGRSNVEAQEKAVSQKPPVGLKAKDLVGIPWMVAFALRADGWYLRSDIIWAKGRSFDPDGAGSCMPESVRDRPTRGHEYVFLLTKQEKYFYDAEAVKEKSITNDQRKPYGSDGAWAMENRDKWATGAEKPQDRDAGKRNLRSVWVINPQPFKGAHFATFPEKLAETCLLAGSPPSCCPRCGAPHTRIIEKQVTYTRNSTGHSADYRENSEVGGGATRLHLRPEISSSTIGWQATCRCDHGGESARSVVLDPFCGSGTVGVVAHKHGRYFLGCDLKPEYLALARCRIEETGC